MRIFLLMLLWIFCAGCLSLSIGCATPKANPWPGHQDEVTVHYIYTDEDLKPKPTDAELKAIEKAERKAKFLAVSGFK